MTIDELKLLNLKRLCREHHASEPSILKDVLGRTKQHASQLLRGKSSIGKETIDKLCKAWDIDELEFVRIDKTSHIDNDSFSSIDPEVKKYCLMLKDILESGDKQAAPAIISNLDAFNASVLKNKTIANMQKDIIELKKSIHDLVLDMGHKQHGAQKKGI